MRLSPLLILAQVAALSSALLVPPHTSEDEIKSLITPVGGSDLALSKASTSRIVRVPCTGCSYKEEGVETDLVFDFNLPENDHTKLKLNGATVLPVKDMEVVLIKTAQIPRSVDTAAYMADAGSKDYPVVGIADVRVISVDFVSEDHYTQYNLQFDFLFLNGKPIKVHGLQVKILEGPDRTLTFGDITATEEGAFAQCGLNLKCLLRKMMAKLMSSKLLPTKVPKIGGWRKGGCKGRKGSPHGLSTPPPPHHRYHGHHHHGHHRRPPHHHSGFHGHHYHQEESVPFLHVVGQVLVPVFVGILAGMLVSSVVLLVARGFVLMFKRIRGARGERRCRRERGPFFGRRRRERRERERLAALEADGEVEKGLLQEDQQQIAQQTTDLPPAYLDEGVEAVEKE